MNHVFGVIESILNVELFGKCGANFHGIKTKFNINVNGFFNRKQQLHTTI